MEIQAQIPAALCAMHNYIHVHDPTDGNLPADDGDNEDGYLEDGPADVVMEDEAAAMEEDNDDDFCQGAAMCDRIAAAIWTQYQRIVVECGLEGLDIIDSEGDKDTGDDDEDAASDM
jgi:hypothetical protein